MVRTGWNDRGGMAARAVPSPLGVGCVGEAIRLFVGEGRCGADVGGRCADERFEFAGFGNPFVLGVVEEFESVGCDCECHIGGLAGSEVNLVESFQLLDRAGE